MTNGMNIADKLAEKIKTSELGAFIDDADLYALSKQAIEKAFFQPRSTGSGYNSGTLPPLVVEWAEAAFKNALKDRVEMIAKTMAESPEFISVLNDAMMLRVFDIARNMGGDLVSTAIYQAQTGSADRLRETLQALLATPR